MLVTTCSRHYRSSVAQGHWTNMTHDWATSVDMEHLDYVRGRRDEFAPGGTLHLVLEVLAYTADEASSNSGGRATVTFEDDGSVSVEDDGRGTDTRRADDGHVIRKPVMSTRDLRFFNDPGAQLLPDGSPRRGISVVAALSESLPHVNRRLEGAWQQRYERGIPVTDLEPLPSDGSTGTAVHFRAGADVAGLQPDAGLLVSAASTSWLRVDVIDRRG